MSADREVQTSYASKVKGTVVYESVSAPKKRPRYEVYVTSSHGSWARLDDAFRWKWSAVFKAWLLRDGNHSVLVLKRPE